MNPESLNKFYNLLDEITVTNTNKYQIAHIRELLEEQNFEEALRVLQELRDPSVKPISPDKEKQDDTHLEDNSKDATTSYIYPKELMNEELEATYIGLLLTDPKSISKYYFLHDDFYFANEDIADLYKVVLFTDGEAYASELAKKSYNFAKNIDAIFPLKEDYKLRVKGRVYNFEKIYVFKSLDAKVLWKPEISLMHC